MRTLDVYLDNELVGHIEENRKGARFRYDLDTADKLAGRPVLSVAFPAKARPFGESKTSNWFNGLLPEGDRRSSICRSLGISPYDWIGLLAEIGWECAGAVRVFEADGARPNGSDWKTVTPTDLAEQLKAISNRAPLATGSTTRMSLGGFQEKMCVTMPPLERGKAHVTATGVSMPTGNAASTHILKPENELEYPGVAESEAWAMTAASYAAQTSRIALLELDDAPATIVVQRFDRTFGENPKRTKRLHQEDACQALGLAPNEKYATTSDAKGNDPTYAAMAALLQRFAADPEQEKVELLRQMTVNLALGNWDAHAKNTAFLYREPMVPTLAPLYDVVPIAEVEPRTEFLSMRVNGIIKPDEITRTDVVAEATTWGIGEEEANSIVAETLNNLETGVQEASAAYPGAGKRHEASALARITRLKK